MYILSFYSAKMKGPRRVLSRRVYYRSVIVVQFVFIVVLIYLIHNRKYGVVLSSRARLADTQHLNRCTEIEGSGHQDQNNETNYTKSEDLYEERLETAQWYCDVDWKEDWLDYAPRGKVWSYGNRDTTIHYCAVPKVGTTMWKRIFRFLHRDFPNGTETPTRPSDIDRIFAHYGDLNNVDVTNMDCFTSVRKYVGGRLFMFTRDPYSRLWSAYIDKFYLPDFWISAAVRAYRAVRNWNVTIPKDEMCFKNITFTDFLKYVVITRKSPNEHWAPIHTLCNPCHVEFDFIGKQETFLEDYKHILGNNKLEYLIEEESFESRVKHETSMLINYNFSIRKRFVNQTGCFVQREVAERLWKVFQFNGYIHEHIDFPEKTMDVVSFEEDPVKELQRLVGKTIQDQKRLGLTIKGQKRSKMVEAYRSVPKELLKAVQDVFVHDFDMFDYDMKPTDIFGT